MCIFGGQIVEQDQSEPKILLDTLTQMSCENTWFQQLAFGAPSLRIVGMSRLSWKWRRRSFAKIAERTYEKRAQALHRRRESSHPEATPLRQGPSFRFV